MTPPDPANKWLEIGTIVAAYGIQGEVKVLSASDFPERFTSKGQRWLRGSEAEQPQPIQLQRGRQVPGKNVYILRLAGIEDRNQAERLVGQQLVVPATDKLPLAAAEYYVADLIGVRVFDQQTQQQLGTVTDFYAASNDLLAVTLTNNPEKTVLIPFVEALVPVVDLDGDRLEIDPPPGLLDL